MKKILSAILMLSTIPAFATGVPSTETTADCDNTTLDTYTGTSNLAVDWAPNEIALHWYDGDTEITSGVQTSCVYDGTLTPPTPTPREGYVFTGWRVRQAQCDLTTLDASIAVTVHDTTHIRWKSINVIGCPMTTMSVGTGNDGDLNPGEWEVTLDYGTIKGIAKCSNTNGSFATPGTPSDTDGENCWCSITNYTPNNGNKCSVASPVWAIPGLEWAGWNCESRSTCKDKCAMVCAGIFVTGGLGSPASRRILFGITSF